MDCQPIPEWIITGQQESQHVHLGNATDPKQSKTIRNLHIRKHKTAGASLWMPNLQSGAQSLILRAQTPCTERAEATELSYASSKHKPENTQQIRLHYL